MIDLYRIYVEYNITSKLINQPSEIKLSSSRLTNSSRDSRDRLLKRQSLLLSNALYYNYSQYYSNPDDHMT